MSNLFCIKTAAKHFRRQQPDTRTDRPGNKYLANRRSIMIDGHIKVLLLKRYLPSRALEFAGAFHARLENGDGRRETFCLGQFNFLGDPACFLSLVFGLHCVQNLPLAAAVAIVTDGLAAECTGKFIECVNGFESVVFGSVTGL